MKNYNKPYDLLPCLKPAFLITARIQIMQRGIARITNIVEQIKTDHSPYNVLKVEAWEKKKSHFREHLKILENLYEDFQKSGKQLTEKFTVLGLLK